MEQWAVILIAALVVFLIVLVYRIPSGEGFVSQRAVAVHAAASELFSGGDTTFTSFKKRIPGSDAVLHDDLQGAWRRGALTPEVVQRAL